MLLAGLPGPADADVVSRGVVVKVEVGEIYVNAGSAAGVHEGARLRIKRPLKLKHPVTRRAVVDWLPIGGADIIDVGQQLPRAVNRPGAAIPGPDRRRRRDRCGPR